MLKVSAKLRTLPTATVCAVPVSVSLAVSATEAKEVKPVALKLTVSFKVAPTQVLTRVKVALGGGVAEIATATTEPVQGAPIVHAVSPPPLTPAALSPVVAAADTLMGTVMTIGPTAPVAIAQPVKVTLPLAGQPLSVPPVAVIPELVLIPDGKVSVMLIGAVVGPLATAILIV